jgi:hypothetical protein
MRRCQAPSSLLIAPCAADKLKVLWPLRPPGELDAPWTRHRVTARGASRDARSSTIRLVRLDGNEAPGSCTTASHSRAPATLKDATGTARERETFNAGGMTVARTQLATRDDGAGRASGSGETLPRRGDAPIQQGPPAPATTDPPALRATLCYAQGTASTNAVPAAAPSGGAPPPGQPRSLPRPHASATVDAARMAPSPRSRNWLEANEVGLP